MALTMWDPFSPWNTRSVSSPGYRPAVDVVRDGTDVLVRLELPGVDVGKDVEIEVRPGRLTVSGQRSKGTENKDGNGTVLLRERRYGSFRREFSLPRGVSADAVEASYDKGLLEVRVHDVTRPDEQPRKIAIADGSAVTTE